MDLPVPLQLLEDAVAVRARQLRVALVHDGGPLAAAAGSGRHHVVRLHGGAASVQAQVEGLNRWAASQSCVAGRQLRCLARCVDVAANARDVEGGKDRTPSCIQERNDRTAAYAYAVGPQHSPCASRPDSLFRPLLGVDAAIGLFAGLHWSGGIAGPRHGVT